MATWTDDTKNTTVFTDDVASDIFGSIGQATGLLTPPTYSIALRETNWADDTKNTANWSNDTKN